jgi:hypothetical protein
MNCPRARVPKDDRRNGTALGITQRVASSLQFTKKRRPVKVRDLN